MSRIEEWGMMDAASRPKRRRPWLLLGGGLLLVGGYVVIRNIRFIAAGMLNPNFAEIHRAYNFNLWELPWTLCGLGLLGWLVGLVWRDLRWLAGALLFLAADLFVLRTYITHVEPNRHVVRHVRIATPKLTRRCGSCICQTSNRVQSVPRRWRCSSKSGTCSRT